MNETMNEIFLSSAYFGAALTIGAFMFGRWLQKKTGFILFNPILVGLLICIAFLKIFNIDYEAYNQGGKYVSYFLNLATISLAILLYEQFEALKKNYLAILLGILSGVLTTGLTLLIFAIIFKFSHTEYVTLLPHAITTAMGMALAEQYKGYVSIAVAGIVVSGITGNVVAVPVCRLFRITEPVARGIGIGTASHALGTAKALEMGEIEGAMAGLSIAVAGLMTVITMAVFARLY